MTARSSDLIRAVIDRPYMLNIQGFGRPGPTPTVGAVYDRAFSHAARSQSAHPRRPYSLGMQAPQ